MNQKNNCTCFSLNENSLVDVVDRKSTNSFSNDNGTNQFCPPMNQSNNCTCLSLIGN